MRQMSKISSGIILISFLVLVFSVSVFGGVAEYLPKDVIVLVETDNAGQLIAQMEKTDVYKLYKDPAFGAFIEHLKKSIKKEMEGADENDIFKLFYDADVLPVGKCAIALMKNSTSEYAEPTPVVISQWGENFDKVKELYEKLKEKNAELGGSLKSSDSFRGGTIEIISDEDEIEVIFGLFKDYFIIGADVEQIKFIIAHIDGSGSDSLAENEDYISTMSALRGENDISVFINLKEIIADSFTTYEPEEGKKTVKMLGFDNIAGFGASASVARTEGKYSMIKALLKVDGEKTGILKMLEPKHSSLPVPGFIDGSTYSYLNYNLDFQNVFAEVAKIMGEIDPMAASVLYSPLIPADADGPAIELKKDIIDHLGSSVVVAASIEQPISDDVPEPSTLFAVEANCNALEKTISKFHSLYIAPGGSDLKRELLGRTLYIVDLGALILATSATGDMSEICRLALSSGQMQSSRLAISFLDTHMVIGTEKDVEKVIRLKGSSSGSLASKEWFNRLRSELPSATGGAVLENGVIAGEILYKTIKSLTKETRRSNSSSLIDIDMGVDYDMLKAMSEEGIVDFSLLPDFDAFKKYLTLTATHIISRSDGFYLEIKEVPTPRN